MKKPRPRTASILVDQDDLRRIRGGDRVLYLPHSDHWEGQFRKFMTPRSPEPAGIGQVTLIPYEPEEPPPDIVHLIIKGEGRNGPYTVRAESRVLVDCFDHGHDPRTGKECWVLDLGAVYEEDQA